MNKRIKRYFLLLTSAALLVFFLASLVWIRDRFETSARQSLDNSLKTELHGTDGPPTELEEHVSQLAAVYGGQVRITVLNPSGQVLADSEVDPGRMENHLDRVEFVLAASTGYGQAVRASETTGIRTIYIARPWGEEGHLLRFATPVAVTGDFVRGLLPGLLLISLAAFLLIGVFAGYVTRRITAPYDNMFAAIEAALQNKDRKVEIQAEYEEMEPVVAYFRTVLSQISDYIQQISAKTREIENITGAMEEGLVMLDEGWNIVLINRQGGELLHVPADTWQKNITYLYRDDRFVRLLRKTRDSGKRQAADIAVGERTLRFYCNPVPGGGYVLLISDVTELARLERMRSDFAANVSHELKTPLTSISGFAELIHAGMVADDATVREYTGKILTESRRLVGLIDDILRLSDIESGSPEELAAVKMAEVFGYTLEILGNQIQERELTVSLEGDCTLQASWERMCELAFNLVDNAVKYNRLGGSIRIGMEQEGFWVENTGDTIPPEHQGRIFERFYRVDKARSRKTGGTGLGLSIVKHVAELYGGRISVQSENGLIRFTVRFGQNGKTA